MISLMCLIWTVNHYITRTCTGPKISSRATRLSSCTSDSTVGLMKYLIGVGGLSVCVCVGIDMIDMG